MQTKVSATGTKVDSSLSNMPSKSESKSKKKVTMEDDSEVEKESQAFKVLTFDQTNALLTLDAVQIQEKLQEIFSLNNHPIDLMQAAILDYYTAAICWGIQQMFTAQQLSGFFTVIHTILHNIKDKQMSMIENALEFNKVFAGIGTEDVKSHGLDFFDSKQAKLLAQYIYTSLFQHYKLYQYMFSHSQTEEIIGTELEVEVAKTATVPYPPPLDEGVLEDMYNDYIATPLPSPPPEPEEEKPDPTKVLEEQLLKSNIFSELTPEEVQDIITSVAKEMLTSLQSELAVKLKEKEGQIIQRINKIHKVVD